VIESFGRGPGHVFNLGHGIQPDVDPERVRALVDAVHEYGAGMSYDAESSGQARAGG
jgi:uroporphyrinogen decarboxylase